MTDSTSDDSSPSPPGGEAFHRVIQRSRQLKLLDELLHACETALVRIDPEDEDGQIVRGRVVAARGELNRLRGLSPPTDQDARRRDRVAALATIRDRAR